MTDNLFDLLKIGERAAARHKRRVMDALRAGSSELLLSEDVVTAAGGKTVRVRVRLLESPTFRFDYHDQVQVGIGKDPQPGDVLIDENPTDEGAGSGAGRGGGSAYDVEMTVDDLIELLIEAWALPNLEPKKRNEIVTEDYNLGDISRKGPMSRIHKKRTIRNAVKRAAASGNELVLHNDDLRFRSPKETVSYSSNAAIVLVRDRSGSMGPFEMKVSRMTAVWLVQFLRRRYDSVAIRFVLHDHAAQEVDEPTFYNVTSGGGTEIASAYRFAQGILEEYPESDYSRYVVHFSDGDDWDVDDSIKEVKQMLPSLAAFFYCEIDRSGSGRASAFWTAQHEIERDNANFVRYSISEEGDVPDALREFLAMNP
jgi:uncharacterized protein